MGRINERVENPQDTGRNGFLEPGRDVGPGLYLNPWQFWRDRTEELTYMNAAESTPYKWPSPPGEYIRRIAEIAQGKLLSQPAKEFPAVRLRYREDE